ncbi:MAG: carboxypeptidase regulatory-like domain-containing protein [Planctomycetota bacterium]|jgi:plastocyanin
MNWKILGALVLVPFVVMGCPASEEGGEAGDDTPVAVGGDTKIDPAKTGTISGTISFDGAPPKRDAIDMSSQDYCADHNEDAILNESAVVNDGKVQWAIVSISSDEVSEYSFKAPSAKPTLDQKGCIYTPHVLTMTAGQKLQILNSDETSHNVNSLATKNPKFNELMSEGSDPLIKKLSKEETFQLKCDVHPWMGSWVGVFPHTFHAVTDAKGGFTLNGIPEGEWTVKVWHETFGELSQKVKVAAGETATANQAYKP